MEHTAVDCHTTEDLTSPAKNGRREEDAMVSKKRRRRGKPGEMCQLNLDVLFLLASHVNPFDLLNLARTCKSLRKLLMHKSSAFVWKTARRQVTGLPDCPADLTEPQYAHLVFFARCHGCGKSCKAVFWEMRRRYCQECRTRRLCSLFSYHEIVRKHDVLATVQDGWVDREQIVSFIHEYEHSSDKQQFIKDKEERFAAICEHASQCEKWHMDKELERKIDLEIGQRERALDIFERLRRRGYEPEIVYFGSHEIKMSCKVLFARSAPLTNKEWDRIWPVWVETMKGFRARRLKEVASPGRTCTPWRCRKGRGP